MYIQIIYGISYTIWSRCMHSLCGDVPEHSGYPSPAEATDIRYLQNVQAVFGTDVTSDSFLSFTATMDIPPFTELFWLLGRQTLPSQFNNPHSVSQNFAVCFLFIIHTIWSFCTIKSIISIYIIYTAIIVIIVFCILHFPDMSFVRTYWSNCICWLLNIDYNDYIVNIVYFLYIEYIDIYIYCIYCKICEILHACSKWK